MQDKLSRSRQELSFELKARLIALTSSLITPAKLEKNCMPQAQLTDKSITSSSGSYLQELKFII